jgi:hypothetical protein
MRKTGKCIGNFGRKPEDKRPFERPRRSWGRITLEWILGKEGRKVWRAVLDAVI